jgi:phosphosulfolactate synthase
MMNITQHLNLPARTTKKRASGRTHILEKGLGLNYLEDLLQVNANLIDFCKLGWGTSLLFGDLQKRLDLYKKYDIEVSLGGTLFEVFFVKKKLDVYKAWLKELGIKSVEISDGTIEISSAVKLGLIEEFSKDFVVYSEVGSKDSEAIVSPAKWVRAIQDEYKSGSSYVILEGRESGTAGMYRGSGEIRMGLIDDILDSGIKPETLIFETPQKAQQSWIIKKMGANVNVGNIAIEDVIPLETLRQGLRSDTLLHFNK